MRPHRDSESHKCAGVARGCQPMRHRYAGLAPPHVHHLRRPGIGSHHPCLAVPPGPHTGAVVEYMATQFLAAEASLPDGLRFRHERVTDLASAGRTTCCVRARARVCATCNTVWVRSARMRVTSASSTRGRSASSVSPTALLRMPALTAHVTYRGSRADQIRFIPQNVRHFKCGKMWNSAHMTL